MEVVCGIITYNPNIIDLKKNVDAAKAQVDYILIVDNHSDNVGEIRKLFEEDTKVSVIRNKRNYGVAVGLNQIMQYALDKGVIWVLTLDQDTFIYPGLISCYEKYIELPDVAMINCHRNDRNYYDYRYYQQKNEYDYTSYCITSATLTNARIVMECGGFDNKMFIDLVDNDMCATLLENGYKIICANHIGYLHSLGDVTKKRIGNYDLKLFHYSPKRIYFLSRNTIYYIKKHHSGYYRLVVIARLMFSSVGFEDNRLKKLWAYFTGIVRGIFWR